MVPQPVAHFPMPVGAGTVTPSIPNAKHKPRKGGKQQRYQIPFPRFGKQPPERIKENKRSMKNEEEIIQRLVCKHYAKMHKNPAYGE